MILPRRPLILLVMALLVAPIAAMPFVAYRPASLQENRMLARPPVHPRTPQDWRRLPRAIDAYLADHFAFREQAIWAGMRVERRLGIKARAQALAVMGEGGQMFLSEGLLRSTGQDVDAARAADYAGFVCEVGARLQAGGAKVATSLAPSPAGVLTDLAPAWAGPARRPTDYDLILGALARCGVPAVDLRPTLIAAARDAKIYRRFDSHWTSLGALLAYNRMVAALERPDWTVAREALTWIPQRVEDGDLPRMAGMAPVAETIEIHERSGLPPGLVRVPLEGGEAPIKPFEVITGHPGPTVLVIGDSFTADLYPQLLAAFAGRIAWIHVDGCRFDWKIVAAVKPDYVMIVPAERNALCNGQRPRGLPKS